MKKILLIILSIMIHFIIYAIDSPVNVAPINGATNQAVTILLDWNSVTGNSGYIYQIDTTPSFNSPILIDGETSLNSSQITVTSLCFNTTYYWHCATKTAVDTSIWSSTWSFTTANTISNTSPSNGATNQPITAELDWSFIAGNTGYIYQIDTLPSFDSPLLFENTTAINSSGAYVSNLYFGTTYYWRAAAKNAVDTSEWSATWSFTTTNSIYNTSPSDQATNQPVLAELDWSSIAGNTGYIYQIDTLPSFDSPLLFENTTAINSSGAYVYDLYFGTTYYWRAAAKNAVDTSEWSATWSFTTTNSIYNTSPSNQATNQPVLAELDWSSIDGNTGYIYQIDTLPSFDSPLLFENTTSINSSGAYVYDLYFGTTYYWRAAAKNAVDTSEWSTTWSFTTTHSMYNTSPSNQVTNQPVLVELDWSSIDGNTGYIYQIDTLPSFDSPLLFENTTAINSSSTYVSDLYFGTTYYWRAAAKNAVDTSEWSATWSLTTTHSMYNTSPSNQATNQPVLVELDWNGINGNTGYIYQIDTLPSFDSPVLEEGTSPIDASYKYVSNLFYGTTYYWRAAAKNTVDTSDWSPTWSFTTIDVLLNYSPTNGAVNISINPAIDWGNLSGSTGYLVGLDTSQTFSSSLYQEQSVSNSQSNYTNLLYGTTYYWHAAGLNAVDTSSWSDTWSFTTAYELTDAPILISPTNSITGLSYSEVDFTWSASPEAVNYQYQVSLNSEFTAIIKSTTTSLISGNIIGLYPHTTYYWRVRGANTNGYSPWSETWSFTTESADLIAPTLITPANNSTNINIDNVILDWESVFGASAYIFEITEDENFISGVTTQQINDTQKEIIGLSEGTQYFWRVKSTDGIVYSDWSEIWNFTTEISALDAPILVTPLNNATGISVESAILDWNSVIGASQYVYEISTDMNFNNNVSTEIINETQKEIFTLSTGTQYFWRVKAINSTLESNWSETWNFITEVPQQYLLTINIVGCGTVNVDGVEYTEPIMIVENSIVTLTAETTESCHFTNWDGNLVGSTNPQQLQMNANKTVTAIFDIVQVDQVANNQQIQVYPNPATEYITINADNINKVEIINITGQTVFTLDQEFEYNNILIKHFNKGLYFIKITTDNGVYIENLVIQ